MSSSDGPIVMSDEQRTDFFISRAGESKAWGLWVARELQNARYSVVYQDRDFDNGDLIVRQIGTALSQCERTLLLLSSAYFSSRFTELEYEYALRERKMLLFRLSDVQLRPEISGFNFTDLFTLDEAMARRALLDTVQRSYGDPKHPYDGPPPVPVPFPVLSITGSPIAVDGSNLVQPSPVLPPPAKVSKDVLENVAYLCDRTLQENELGEILKSDPSWQGSVICIAHGDEIEKVERFVARLHTHSIPQWIPMPDRLIRDVFVEWPKVTRATTAQSFRRDLAMAAEKQMVARKLDGGAVAVVRSNLLVAPWCGDRGVELIQAFVEFWREFTVPASSLLLVCLIVRYPVDRRASIVRKFQRWMSGAPSEKILLVLEGKSEASIDCHVLTRLEAIERGEAESWTELPEVRRYRNVDLDQIRQLYADLSLEAIPMGDLAPRLTQLLT